MTRRTPDQYDWNTCSFDETILDKHFTSPRRGKISFVVVHHMTILGDGSGRALTGCWNTWQRREASAQYGVEENLVRQFVWDKDAAWATGNSAGNHSGISIEHANSKAGPSWTISERTWKTGARLAAYLHKLYKLGRPTSTNGGRGGTLRKHSSFTSTACPGPFMDSIWGQYVAEAQRVYDQITSATPPPVVPPVVEPEPDGRLLFGRVLTLNIRGANHDPSPSDPEHWSKRKAGVLSVINNERPSIVCLQEVNTTQQVVDVNNGVAEALDYWPSRGRNYTWIDDKKGTGKFHVHSSRDIQLTKYQDRRMLIQDVERLDIDRRAWLINTHAPSGSDAERTKFAKALVRNLPKDGRPIALCGDLNKEQVTRGTLRGILEAEGLRRLEVVDPSMVNQHIDSYNAFQPPTGDRLDADEIYTKGFDADNSELVLSRQGLLDHYAKVTTLYIPA